MTEVGALDKSIRPPTVSVLLVTRTGEEAAFLSSLMSQNYDEPFEIIVVEGGNRSQAKNLAIAKSTAPLVAFIDADCQAGSDWLANLVSTLPNEENVVGIGGVSKGHDSSGTWQQAIDGVFSTYLGTLDSPSLISVPRRDRHPVKALSGHNSLFKRKPLIDAGGFDERFELNEDTDISSRLRERGYVLILDHSVFVYHMRRRTLPDFGRQFFLYGIGRMRSILTHRRYIDLRIMGLFSLAILVGAASFLWPVLVLVGSAVYFSLIAICSLIGAKRIQSISNSPQILLLFTLEHISYLVGMLTGLLLGPWKEPSTWKSARIVRHAYVPRPNEPTERTLPS